MKFYIKSFLPCINKEVKLFEVKNESIFSILKFILADNKKDIAECFEEVIKEHLEDQTLYSQLNIIDKFILLLTLRANCVSNELEFAISTSKRVRIILTDLIKSITKYIENRDKVITVIEGELYIKLSYPKQIYIDGIDEAILKVISKITAGNEIIDFQSLSDSEQQLFIEKLPGSFTKEILDYIEETSTLLKSIYILKRSDIEIPIGLYDNTIFEFLRVIFKDNLMDYYEMQYSVITKINMSNDHFLNQTPNESKLFISMHNDFIKKQEEQLNKGKK